MKGIFFLFFIGITGMALGQDSGTVRVFKDPRIDSLVRKQVEINEFTTRNARRNVAGYRILVISTNNRNQAMEAKNKLFREFPGLKTYLMYQSPYYRLKAGNFRDREEAELYQKDIQRFFPKGVYIVRDVIEVRPEKTSDFQ